MTDFFVSYTAADEKWAEWIAYTLEERGYSVVIQRWDFGPGSNFVLEMQRAAREAKRTIMVLSPDYMKSQFASPEWASAFAADPQGLKRTLLPIIVRECKPEGLLGQIVHLNLVGRGQEEARNELLQGVRTERRKPTIRPLFPGEEVDDQKFFPGPSKATVSASPEVYLPKIRRDPSDVEKRRFVRAAFDQIRAHFELALRETSRSYDGLDFDLQSVTAQEFTAEIFLHGRSAAACRIWLGGMLAQNGISYAEGRHNFHSNSCNEILSLTTDHGDLGLASLMGGLSFSSRSEEIDFKHMRAEQAADYLWRRFIANVERIR